jgi:hypothetical protein
MAADQSAAAAFGAALLAVAILGPAPAEADRPRRSPHTTQTGDRRNELEEQVRGFGFERDVADLVSRRGGWRHSIAMRVTITRPRLIGKHQYAGCG